MSQLVDRIAQRLRPASPAPRRVSRLGSAATPLAGVGPSGDEGAVAWTERRRALLVFLTGGCRTCQVLWSGLAAGRRGVGAELIVITPDPGIESRRTITRLAPPDVTVLMSSAAWIDYGVSGAPWYALVVEGTVTAEGPATTWEQLQAVIDAPVN